MKENQINFSRYSFDEMLSSVWPCETRIKDYTGFCALFDFFFLYTFVTVFFFLKFCLPYNAKTNGNKHFHFLTVKSLVGWWWWARGKFPASCWVVHKLLDETMLGSKIRSRFRSFIADCWTAYISVDSSLSLQIPLRLFELLAKVSSVECNDSFAGLGSWHSVSISGAETEI